MPRALKIGITIVTIVGVLLIVAGTLLFVGLPHLASSQTVRREIRLANQGSIFVDGKKRSRSEHGFSQRAGYRPPGSTKIEWFGDVSDGVEPRVYQAGALVVVIDPPAAQLFVRIHVTRVEAEPERDRGSDVNRHQNVSPMTPENWKNFVLVFPNDLGPFPISFYAEKNGMTIEDISRVNELGGKRDRKYPTTYIESFDPETRDLRCSYHLDNTSAWPLNLRLSDDGTRLVLIGIGGSSR